MGIINVTSEGFVSWGESKGYREVYVLILQALSLLRNDQYQ